MEFTHRLRSRLVLAVLAAAHIVIASIGVSALLAPAAATAVQSVPYKINFQGRLTDASGNVLSNGSYNIKFRVYDALTSGTNLWEGDRIATASDNRVTIANGIFSIQFGDTTKGDPALTAALFNNQTHPALYLEVEMPTPATATCSTNGCAVWTELPMTPRQPLGSTPYAFNSDTLDGIDSSGFVQLTPAGAQTGSINVQNNVTAAGTIQGAAATVTGANGLTLGSTTAAGGIVFNDGTVNARAVTLAVTGLTNSYALNLPVAAPSVSQCLSTSSGSASQLVFIACPPSGNANPALSNLAAVAINTSLISDTNNNDDLGSAAIGWRTGYFATSTLTPSLDAISAGVFSIAPATATSIIMGGNAAATLTQKVANSSATAFKLQTAGGTSLLVFDTTANTLTVGTSDTTGTLLVLDTKTGTGDPTGVNGGMYYNSSDNKFRCYEQSRWTDCTSSIMDEDTLDRSDDFTSGTVGSGAIGELGWSLLNGAALVPKAGEQNHPGIVTMGTGITTGTISRLTLSNATGTSSMVAGDANYVSAIVRPLSGTTTMSVRIGLTNNPATSAEGAQGIYWAFTAATSANWRTVTRDGVGVTANSTTTPYAAATWYKLEIKKNNAGNWDFYLNGTLVFTHSTNIPTATTAMYPVIAIETNNTTTKTLDVDWFRLRSTVLTR